MYLGYRSLRRQIRMLARGGRLGDLVLVRTKADMGRKKASTMDKEFEHFKSLCSDAQKGLDLAMPAQHVAITTAPADDEQDPLVEIGEVQRILQGIAKRQQEKARELAQVSLQKVEGILY